MNVSIVGATGYTGYELVKILSRHPYLEISALTSDSAAGSRYSDIYDGLRNLVDDKIVPNDYEKISSVSDIIYLCLPHSSSQEAANYFYNKGKTVIDLSADFRIRDKNIYESAYNVQHNYPDLLDKAAYGIPELYRSEIVESNLIANPGCYPTSVLIPVHPLIQNSLIDESYIIADCKSGVSGAGKKLSEKTHFCEVNNDFKPYSIFSHRHSPEINFWLQEISRDTNVVFTPHLLPITRGIESTIYCKTVRSGDYVRDFLAEYYEDSFFVRVLDKSEIPSISTVSHSNFIDIGVFEENGTLIIVSCIDNLIKGASGQAVQNTNLIMGFEENIGLV